MGSCCGADLSDPELENANSIEEMYNKSSNIYDEYKRAIDILEIFKSKLKKNQVIEEMKKLNSFARDDDYLSMKYLNNDLTNYCNKL